ncbi:conserved protein, unknown function [Plasmodium vinckei vinckei]|uniref:DUF155 domain-containing protein n=1 Tax=Plasmodium vinckei vinckei TaxID=54757 RepID=A0A081IBW9_PLAVN|nr:conserved protein, unknown function [Plasmodium vinckei vinckei]KEG01177.1 hypothetical protein YYE_03765 [Plasmodium vinckei vinckei]VEV55150.1 conserved protein, unknown function [Plasmodium vinckei vinckei]
MKKINQPNENEQNNDYAIHFEKKNIIPKNKYEEHNTYTILHTNKDDLIKYKTQDKTQDNHISPNGHNNIKPFQVKFLSHVKSYDLKKLSIILFYKNIKYCFFDNNNILCVFLTPDKATKSFYSIEKIYNIDNLSFKNNVTDQNAQYIIFIFKNGSIVIWENFYNPEKYDYFINNLILFFNLYSNEPLLTFAIQNDKIYYSLKLQKQANQTSNITKRPYIELDTQNIENENNNVNKINEHINQDLTTNPLESDTFNYDSSENYNFVFEDINEEENHEKKKKISSSRVIYLTNNSIEQKLTISFALSQSIRLDVHEFLMDNAINILFTISKEIATNGKCTVSKKQLSNMIDVYSSIINVNAVQDFLDVPEYFWNKVQYEHMWFEMHKYMEIPERIKILNKRYTYYKDFLNAIKSEVYNKNTFNTYRIVVLLLFIHVLALIFNDMFFEN